MGWAAAVVGWVGARASYVTRSNVTQNAPEQVFWGAGAAAWTGWTSVPAPISSATRPAARAVRRFMGFLPTCHALCTFNDTVPPRSLAVQATEPPA